MFDYVCAQAAAQVATFSSEAGEAVLQQLTALLGDLLRILNWNGNLPGGATTVQQPSADLSPDEDTEQVQHLANPV